jgi:hypothetical protein
MLGTELSPWIESLLDKTIQMLQNDIVKKKIQLLIIHPFLQYVIELIFPYVIILGAIFGTMFLMMISILVLLIFRLNGAGTPSIVAGSL